MAQAEGLIAPVTFDDAVFTLSGLWRREVQTVVGTVNGDAPTDDAHRVAISLDQLDRISRLDAGDGVIVAETGVPVGAIRTEAAALGLWCPALRWLPAATCIGAAVAGGHGRRSRVYGSVADHLLGTAFASPAVELVRHGGAAIKNATGYNLSAMVAGSRGRLGVILDVTLRLVPLPPSRQTITFEFESDPQLRAAVLPLANATMSRDANSTEYLADAVEIVQTAARPGGWMRVECEGIVERLVVGRIERLGKLGQRLGGTLAPAERASDGVLAGQTLLRSSASRLVGDVILSEFRKVREPQSLIRLALEATGGGFELTGDPTAPDLFRSSLGDLAAMGRRSGGSAVERRLKSAFDPKNLLTTQPLPLCSND